MQNFSAVNPRGMDMKKLIAALVAMAFAAGTAFAQAPQPVQPGQYSDSNLPASAPAKPAAKKAQKKSVKKHKKAKKSKKSAAKSHKAKKTHRKAPAKAAE